MLIETKIKDATMVGFGDQVFKVVNGIADVSEEAFKHLINFPEWSHVTHEVEADVLKQLGKVEAEVKTLEQMTVKELQVEAEKLGINYAGLKKPELLAAIQNHKE